MIKIRIVILILMIAVFSSCNNKKEEKSVVDYVNSFIGTGGHGHTFPGATAPFGMVQLSPDTRLDTWDGCSGYHYSDSVIYGFSHTHLSGTGVSDYGDILVMPIIGEMVLNNGSDGTKGYRSKFNHNTENAKPGFYKVTLTDNNIDAELTATQRVGFHKYTFNNKANNKSILIDLLHRDKVLSSWLKVINTTEIEGYRESEAWAMKQKIYFYAQFSQPFTNYNLALNDTIINNVDSLNGNNIKAWFNFNDDSNKVLLKVGISPVSVENAKLNLISEIPLWDFEKTKLQTKLMWEDELNKIKVYSNSDIEKEIFYTSLYHTMIAPNIYNDVDNRYLGRDFNIHKTDNFDYYTVFSLWDTYRALHPLFTIIDHKRTNDFINTFIQQYKHGGLLPIWELSSNETNCMIGYHAVSVIADAYAKGIRDWDSEMALKAMIASANSDNFGLKYYKQNGYISAEEEAESVSKTLEYAYNDWCIATMAMAMGKKNIANEFYLRSQYYKNVFDPITKFMRSRTNGGWKTPFDPKEVNNNFTEANSWQYSYYTPHDMSYFIEKHGNMEMTVNFIDSLFNVSNEISGRNQVDITGLIGQYAHGNEPSHHIAYLYNFCEQPWKTQEKVNYIYSKFYTNKPDGYIGNEDCGQMSAWGVFTALGFYPICPGDTNYIIGTPMFDKIELKTANNKVLIIKTVNRSSKNIYIKSATLNGKEYNKSFISHNDIMQGGELVFTMSSKPNKKWGIGDCNTPKTAVVGVKLLPNPYISTDSRTFKDSIKVEIKGVNGCKIYFTTDGSEPTFSSNIYKNSITVKENTILKYFADKQDYRRSFTQQSVFAKQNKHLKISSISEYAKQYSANGLNSLIDGLKGNEDYRLGEWLGFEGKDLSVTIEIIKKIKANKIEIRFLQDENAWIFLPSQVELYTSVDGENFKSIKTINTDIPLKQKGVTIKKYVFNVDLSKYKYFKIIGKSIITCPVWHKGNGYKCWLFSDEISVE